MPEVHQALWKRHHILFIIGGGITRIVQVNDTCLHHALKSQYRKKERQLMLQKHPDHSQKVPDRDRIINGNCKV